MLRPQDSALTERNEGIEFRALRYLVTSYNFTGPTSELLANRIMDEPLGPTARPSLDSLEGEAGAIAMAPVPQHLLDNMETFYDEYFSVRNEWLKLNGSNALNPLWESRVKKIPQTVENLNEIRAAAMKTARELRTEINKNLLTRLDEQAEALLQDLIKDLDKMPSVIAAIKKNIADNRTNSPILQFLQSRPNASLPNSQPGQHNPSWVCPQTPVLAMPRRSRLAFQTPIA